MTEKKKPRPFDKFLTGLELVTIIQVSQFMLGLAHTYSQGPCIVAQSLPGIFES